MSREKELLWRTNKYEVMLHSQKQYRIIQKSIQDISLEELSSLINEAIAIPAASGSIVNAYEHMWGYFKKKATHEEKEQTFITLHNFKKGSVSEMELLKWMAELAMKYDETYLLNSSVIASFIKKNDD